MTAPAGCRRASSASGSRTCSRSAAIRRSTCRRTSSRRRAARGASGRRTRRRSACRRCARRSPSAERRARRPVDPDRNVLVTLGGMQGALPRRAGLRRARGVHAPSFFFPQLVAAAGGHCAATGGVDGPPDWDAFAAAIDAETTLAIVNTPVNPTGYVFRAGRPRRDRGRARGEPTRCCSRDEAYAGVLYDGLEHLSPASHPGSAPSGRSSCAASRRRTAMAAWRVGYAVGPRDGDRRARARRSPWQALAIDGVAQAAALAALTGPQDWIEAAVAELAEMRPRAIDGGERDRRPARRAPRGGARSSGRRSTATRTSGATSLAREHGITAAPGPPLRAPRRRTCASRSAAAPTRARALLERLSAARRPGGRR